MDDWMNPAPGAMGHRDRANWEIGAYHGSPNITLVHRYELNIDGGEYGRVSGNAEQIQLSWPSPSFRSSFPILSS